MCACVAGGCRGPLFVLGPFVLAVMDCVAAPCLGAFRVVFSFVGKIMVCVPFFFWPRRFGRGNVLFFG